MGSRTKQKLRIKSLDEFEKLYLPNRFKAREDEINFDKDSLGVKIAKESVKKIKKKLKK